MRPKRLTRPRVVLLLLLLAALLGTAFTQWRSAIRRNRSLPDEPFRIAGNLYYVGHTGLASFLLAGPDGHVLIDGGFPEHGPLIIESVEKLGFEIEDVKILLNSHAHSDHAGGLAVIQEASGAALWVSEGDAELMSAGGRGDRALGPARHLWHLGALRFDPPRIDRTFAHGEVVRLGPIELTAHVTAGHTRGCTSWSFPLAVPGDTLLAVSICSLTLFPFVSLDPETGAYPGIDRDWRESIATLRSLPADVFLGAHTAWFGLDRKRRRQEAVGDPGPFIDPDGYRAFIDRAERSLWRRTAPTSTGGDSALDPERLDAPRSGRSLEAIQEPLDGPGQRTPLVEGRGAGRARATGSGPGE